MRKTPIKPSTKLMRRSRMKSGRPLKRGKRLTRSVALRAKLRASLFPKRRHPEYRRWIATENPCELAGKITAIRLSSYDRRLADLAYQHVCWGRIDPAHVGEKQSQGAYDVGRIVPLCRAAHVFYDEHRSNWQAMTCFTEADMESAAAGYALKWVERGGTL